ncbi:MAG: hypothetical protein ACTSPE_03225 [Candidatus Thorarchaeota archaeon]
MSSTGLDPEKVRYISLVRKEGGEPVLGIPYREMSVDPDLVASFVLAVIIFENRQLRTFTKEGYVVLIEEGSHVVGLLIIDKVEEEGPYREALRLIINTFEARYEAQFKSWSGDIRPFREFALFILTVFPYRILDPNLVPTLITGSEAVPDHRTKIPWAVGETDKKLELVKEYINGKRTIMDIIEACGFDEAEGMALFSMLDRYKWITLSRAVTDDTVLVKLMEPPAVLIGAYGEHLVRIVEQCDGTRKLGQIANDLNLNRDVVRTLAKTLVNAGVLGFAGTSDKEESASDEP